MPLPSHRIAVIVLAAGKGTRMKSRLVKVLHPMAGIPMIRYPLEAAKKLGPEKVVLVVGHQATRIKEELRGESVTFVTQRLQLGTGHAVACAKTVLGSFKGNILILSGDVPLIRPRTLRELIDTHIAGRATVTVLTTHVEDPRGYGRVVRGEDGAVVKIVEDRDATPEERKISEINSGIYCIGAPFLFRAVEKIRAHNAQSEYYLTEVVSLCLKGGRRTLATIVPRPDEVMGINDRADLSRACRTVRREILERHMRRGVTVVNPEATYVDKNVKIGRDTVIFPNCHLEGTTVIGADCVIEHGSKIVDSSVGAGATIRMSSLVSSSRIKAGTVIGPFAHIENSGRGATKGRSQS